MAGADRFYLVFVSKCQSTVWRDPLRIFTIGGRIQFASFPYDGATLSAEPEPAENILISTSGLVHVRTSKYRRGASLIFYSGFTVSYLRLQPTTLVHTYKFTGHTETHFASTPNDGRVFFGVPFGIGYDSSATIAKTGRIRLSMDVTLPTGTSDLALGSYTFGLGFSR